MHLIYINEIGEDYKGQRQYEFIFSKCDELDVDEWFTIPASASIASKSPDVKYVDLVGLLKDSDIVLDLVQNSDYFGLIDAVDGVIALGWEKFNHEAQEERLTFKFGESMENVNKKIKSKGLCLTNQEININAL